MTPAGEFLAAEIRRDGPIPFRRFMEVALYHPEHGYYRRARDPFGKAGRLLHRRADAAGLRHPRWRRASASSTGRWASRAASPWWNWERGGGEMAEAFAEWRYVPVDLDSGALPERFRGVVFSNEFFDALPVDAVVLPRRRIPRAARGARPTSVSPGRPAPPFATRRRDYLRRYFPPPEEGRWYEVNLDALAWIERICGALERGLRAHHRLRIHARREPSGFPPAR